MSDTEIDAMEAGSEMDDAIYRIVADIEGIGLPPAICPSTDWNDAMFAAETFGLLKSHRLGISSLDGLWELKYYEHYSGNERRAAAPTGPLAICRAILKLSRKQ